MASKKKNNSQPEETLDVAMVADIEEANAEDATATFEVLPPEAAEEAEAVEEVAESADVIPMEKHSAADVPDDADDAAGSQQESGVPTMLSLGRLEEDLQRLQASWVGVEQQLAAKDSEIAYLNDEREVHIAAFKSLQTDLDELLDEYDSLQGKCEAHEAALVEAEQRVKCHDDVVAGRDRQIIALQGEVKAAAEKNAQLREESRLLRAQIKAKEAEQRAAAANRVALEKQLAECKEDMQGLEAYIDTRKSDWDALNRELADYKDALVGMRDELDARDRTISDHDRKTAVLDRQIEELQKQCAELDGRRAERELANKELNTLLSEKASEMELLRKERDDAQVGSEAMVARLQDHKIRIHSLEHEISELGCKLKAIRETADQEVDDARSQARKEISEAAEQLSESQATVDCLTQQAAQTEKRLEDVQTELERAEQGLTALREANQRLENRLVDESNRSQKIGDELEAVRSAESQVRTEYEAFQERMEIRLEANAELISKLESELETRNSAIELLESNADKLGAIKDNVKKLDAQIVEGVQSSGSVRPSVAGRNLMLSVEGMPSIKFPIYKPCMTIGRSSDSDIRLRRKYISRCHARLTEDETGIRIEDMDSKNGLYVNEEAVTESYLHDGDVVDIGEVQLRYVEDGQAA